jgi:hypothetical protein
LSRPAASLPGYIRLKAYLTGITEHTDWRAPFQPILREQIRPAAVHTSSAVCFKWMLAQADGHWQDFGLARNVKQIANA